MELTITAGSNDHKGDPDEPVADRGSEPDGTAEAQADDPPTNPAPSLPELLPQHLAELRASRLMDETIIANGVYSESDPKAVGILINWGAARAKLLGAVLVYPHSARDGNPLGHAPVKPDRPRDRGDKPGKVKYENPRQRPNRLYIPAGARAALADPTAPLFVTEGCKKALAATQHGFPCVSLPGVWNWVAPREKKNGKKVGKLALNDDLAAIAWKGRWVYICFDSDAVSKPEVARAERALAESLRSQGANVRIVRLPTEPDGAKNGLDDFLARHGPDALHPLVEAAVPVAEPAAPKVDPAAFTDSGYIGLNGCTFHYVLSRDENSTLRCRTLQVEGTLVTGARNLTNLFNDELADAHAVAQDDRQWPKVKDFQPKRSAVFGRIVLVVTEPGVDGRCRYVDAEAHSPQTAFPFHAGAQARRVREVNPLDRPTEDEM